MSPTRKPLPASLRTLPVTVESAAVAGVSQRRLRGQEFCRIDHGVYLHCSTAPTVKDIAVARAALIPGAVITSYSAAHIHGLPLPWWVAGDDPRQFTHLQFIQPSVSRSTRFRKVDQRALKPGSPLQTITAFAGAMRAPIVSPALAWLLVARDLRFDYLVAIADALLRRPRPRFESQGSPLATRSELGGLIHSHRGSAGVARARRALEFAREGADSVLETRARLGVMAAGLPEPALNHPVYDREGVVLRVPDMTWEGLWVELDGRHHLSPAQVARDRAHDELAFDRGVHTLRLLSSDLPRIRQVAMSDDALLAELAQSTLVKKIAKRLSAR